MLHQNDAVEAVQNAFDAGAASVLLEMACGSGKSFIMYTLLQDMSLAVVVFPSLALIAQFTETYLAETPHLVVSSEASTDPARIRAYFATSFPHLICVTYNSLELLIGVLDGRQIDRAFFDEAHHVGSPKYSKLIVGRTDVYAQQVHLTATPRDNTDYGERVFHFPYSHALDLEMVRRFRIRLCIRPRNDETVAQDYHRLLADAARKTNHTKALVFSSNVVAMDDGDITCVDAFTQPDIMVDVLREMDWSVPLEFSKITATTSASDRDALLARFESKLFVFIFFSNFHFHESSFS